MSFLSGITSVAVGGIWKVVAIGLLAGMVASSSYLGYQWHMAAHDRDTARSDLVAERQVSDDLRSSIREQNRAVEMMGKAKAVAEARGAMAQQLAAANGRRFDGALEQIRSAKATTCDEAMPAVNKVLEALR